MHRLYLLPFQAEALEAFGAESDYSAGNPEFLQIARGHEAEVAQGLGLEMGRLLANCPEFLVDMSFLLDRLGARSVEQIAQLDAPGGRTGEFAAFEREAGEEAVALSGKLTRANDHWRFRLSARRLPGGVRLYESSFETTTREFGAAVEALLRQFGEALCGPHALFAPQLPTSHVPALFSYFRALEGLRKTEAGEPECLVATMTHLAAALDDDPEMDTAVELLTATLERFVDAEDLPRDLLRRLLDRLIQEQRGTPALVRHRGILDYQEKRYEAAAGWLRRALALGDERGICAWLLARCAEMREDWIDMNGWGQVLIEESPDDTDHLLLAGMAACKVDQPHRAVDLWRRALEIDPFQPATRANLVVALLDTGDADEALRELQVGFDQGEVPWEFLRTAVLVYHRVGREEAARVALRAFVADRPLAAEEMLEAARIAERLDDRFTAKRLTEDLLALECDSETGDLAARLLAEFVAPGFERMFQAAADAVVEGHGDLHIEELVAWAERVPFCWHAWYLLGNAAWQGCRWDIAEEAMQRAAELRPGHADIYNRWGAIFLEQGRLDEAIEHFGRALRDDPANQHFLSNLALALAYARRFAEASGVLAKLSRQGTDSAQARAVKLVILKIARDPEFPLPSGGFVRIAAKELDGPAPAPPDGRPAAPPDRCVDAAIRRRPWLDVLARWREWWRFPRKKP